MKKIVSLTILAILIYTIGFSQVITREFKPFVRPLKDSLKVYQTNYATLLIDYVSKADSLEIRGNTLSVTTPPKEMTIVGMFKESCWCTVDGYVYNNEVKVIPTVKRTITKNDVIKLFKEDSLEYTPYYSMTYGARPHDELIEKFKKKYGISCDDVTMTAIYNKFYKTQAIANKDKQLENNNIPINLFRVVIEKNIIGNPEITVYYKNISDKNIDAVDLNIYCYNRYGEPVKKYSTGSNLCVATSQDIILSGETQNSTWVLYGQELTTNVKVFLSKVHFTNGKTLVVANKQLTKIEGKLE